MNLIYKAARKKCGVTYFLYKNKCSENSSEPTFVKLSVEAQYFQAMYYVVQIYTSSYIWRFIGPQLLAFSMEMTKPRKYWINGRCI